MIILDARSVYPSLAGAEQQVRRWFEATRLVAEGGEVCLGGQREQVWKRRPLSDGTPVGSRSDS